jgi:amidase
MISHAAPFDITHHRATGLLCGMPDGLPVSVVLIGKHFDEPAFYRAAAAF